MVSSLHHALRTPRCRNVPSSTVPLTLKTCRLPSMEMDSFMKIGAKDGAEGAMDVQTPPACQQGLLPPGALGAGPGHVCTSGEGGAMLPPLPFLTSRVV